MSKTIKEAIAFADQLCRLNAHSAETKTAWLQELDNRVQSELWHWSPQDMLKYDWESCSDHELLIPAPYERIYGWWLAANICLADGEFEHYQNYYGIFDSIWKEFSRWTVRERGGVIL